MVRLPCMLEQVATTHERTKADQLKRIVGAEVGITVQSMVSHFTTCFACRLSSQTQVEFRAAQPLPAW